MVWVGLVPARAAATIELLLRYQIMTHTDHYKYEASQMMNEDLKHLRDADKVDKPRLFAEYCRKAIGAKEAGKMPIRDAAYAIARTMFIKELEEPLFDDLTGLAGELELPVEFVRGGVAQKWQELISLVDQYEKAHETEAWLEKVEHEQANMERRTKQAFDEHGDK